MKHIWLISITWLDVAGKSGGKISSERKSSLIFIIWCSSRRMAEQYLNGRHTSSSNSHSSWCAFVFFGLASLLLVACDIYLLMPIARILFYCYNIYSWSIVIFILWIDCSDFPKGILLNLCSLWPCLALISFCVLITFGVIDPFRTDGS